MGNISEAVVAMQVVQCLIVILKYGHETDYIDHG